MDRIEETLPGGNECTRRAFLRATTAGVAGALALDLGQPAIGAAPTSLPLRLEPSSLLGTCTRVDGPAIIPATVTP